MNCSCQHDIDLLWERVFAYQNKFDGLGFLMICICFLIIYMFVTMVKTEEFDERIKDLEGELQ